MLAVGDEIDEQREPAKEYRVRSVPIVLIFKDGRLVDTLVGVRSLDTFKAAVDKTLQSG